MIVRDEAENIVACLASAREAVDEMIVVDTGSVDNTVMLAQSQGAKVIPFTWIDDFSAARNAALPHASGDWVFMIDADQRLAPGGAKAIRQAVSEGGFDCGVVPQYDALRMDVTPDQIATRPELFRAPVYLHCLFVNDHKLAWQNRVHEMVVWVNDPKRRQRQIHAPIIHYGNLPDVRVQLGKNERNFRLIEKSLATDPDNLILNVYYLAEAYHRGATREVRELAENVWQRLARNFSESNPLRHPRFLNVVSIHMWFLIQQGRREEALEVLKQAGGWGLGHPAPTWMGATCLETLGYAANGPTRETYLARAEDLYRNLKQQHGQMFPTEVSEGVTSWLADLGLGRIAARRGLPQKALHHFEAALGELAETHDHTREALLGLIEALLDLGRYREAMRAVRKAKDPNDPDLAVLRADAQEQMGNFKACLLTLTPLLGDQENQFKSWSVGRRFGELICLIQIYRAQPMAGDGPVGTLGAVLRGVAPAQLGDVAPSPRLERVLAHLAKTAEPGLTAPLLNEETASHLPHLSALAKQILNPEDCGQ